MTTDPGDLVLDLTCGSGAMPIQAESWGRRWISCDVSAVSIAIARERIITTTYPYHLLKDSPEGSLKDHELEQELHPPENRDRIPKPQPFPSSHKPDPAKGFVNERQVRVSAKTLAYGPDLADPKDVIRHPDRTLKDPKKVRVAADFEVCSDSPYRAVPPEHILTPPPSSESRKGRKDPDNLEEMLRQGFEIPDDADLASSRIAVSLPQSGIGENGRNRFQVENLQPSTNTDITHTGVIIDGKSGKRSKAVFYIGRSSEIIAKTRTTFALRAAGEENAETVVMVGFGFDPDNAESAIRTNADKRVLRVQAHRDFQLEGLKDKKRDTAFTIISEPEVTIVSTGNPEDPDEVTLEVTGISSYDPGKGTAEPSIRKIMAIMVDTGYDGMRFLPSRYNVIPVNRNRRALKSLHAAFRGTIDDQSWKRMQTYVTLPFRLPPTEAAADAIEDQGETRPATRIAVKAIDQTGIEHMLVIDNPRNGEWH